MVPHSIILLLVVAVGLAPGALGAKILVGMTMIINTPSQHILMGAITEPLVARGHEVVLLTPQNKITKGLSENAITDTIFFQNSHTREEMQEIVDKVSRLVAIFSKGSLSDIYNAATEQFYLFSEGCRRLWADKDTIRQLKEEKFDLIITMPVDGCDGLLSEYLQVPFVAMTPVRRAPTFSEDTYGMSVPSSYAPFHVFTRYTDDMNFFQRTVNFLLRFVAEPISATMFTSPVRKIQLEQNIRPDLSVIQLLGKAQLWLCQSHTAVDFTQPSAPNYVSIGGITAKPANPLPQELEEFVEGSGEHGVIIFTLGSMVASFSNSNLTEILAKVFSELPQRVVWRYKGTKPSNLGNNTLIADWLPQNDLLGHPKTRLLIYHGGANGVYEAAWHGVPLLLIPLALDQMSNAVRIQAKGLGFAIDKNTLTEDIVRDALKEILLNPKYTVNAKRASGIMKDEIVPIRERVAHQIEHVIKFGDSHLRTRALELNFLQLNSVDVLVFIAVVLAIFVVIAGWICRKCFSCCCSRLCSGSAKTKTD